MDREETIDGLRRVVHEQQAQLAGERAARRRLQETLERRLERLERAPRRAAGSPLPGRFLFRALVLVAALGWIMGPGAVMAYQAPGAWLCSSGDTSTGCGSATITVMNEYRAGIAAVVGPDGNIYDLGGYYANAYFGTLEQDNLTANTSTLKVFLPGPRAYEAAVVGPNGAIYSIGGANGTSYMTSVVSYTLGATYWQTKASMPTGRDLLGAAVGPDGNFYAIGGVGGSGVVNANEAYNPLTDTWTSKAAMPSARGGLGVTAGPDGKIYAVGGLANGFGLLGVVEAYDPATNTWTCSAGDSNCTAAQQTIAPMPTARWGLTVATGPDGKLYAIGGFGSDYLNTVEAYDPNSNTWTCSVGDAATGCASKTLPPMPTPRTYLAAVTGPDGKIYVLGGNNAGATNGGLHTIEAYTGIAPGSYATGHTGLAGVGIGGPGVSGTGTYGGSFGGTVAQLHLVPGITTGHPTTGTFQEGDLYLDAAGHLFICTQGGVYGSNSPPTWSESNGSAPLVDISTGWNLLAAPTAPAYTAQSLTTQIDGQGGHVSAISIYSNGAYRVFVPGSSTDFTVPENRGFWLLEKTASVTWKPG